MTATPGILEAFARSLGGRVGKCNLHNVNVGEVARQQVRTRFGDYRVTVWGSESKIAIELQGFDMHVTFSVNDIDRICRFTRPLGAVTGLACPVFVAADRSGGADAWLRAPQNVSLVADLDLQAGESLQVYGNGLTLIGGPERARRDTLSKLAALADRLRCEGEDGLVDGLPFSAQALPRELRQLEDLIRRFAIGDDDARGELLANASAAQRDELRTRVAPLFARIDEFLAAFGSQPLSNEAVLLARLAEAAAELPDREA